MDSRSHVNVLEFVACYEDVAEANGWLCWHPEIAM
jgi:hypothetical protein